jgi:hypothetical protein
MACRRAGASSQTRLIVTKVRSLLRYFDTRTDLGFGTHSQRVGFLRIENNDNAVFSIGTVFVLHGRPQPGTLAAMKTRPLFTRKDGVPTAPTRHCA